MAGWWVDDVELQMHTSTKTTSHDHLRAHQQRRRPQQTYWAVWGLMRVKGCTHAHTWVLFQVSFEDIGTHLNDNLNFQETTCLTSSIFKFGHRPNLTGLLIWYPSPYVVYERDTRTYRQWNIVRLGIAAVCVCVSAGGVKRDNTLIENMVVHIHSWY